MNHRKNTRSRLAFGATTIAFGLSISACAAFAETFTLRIGSGHPTGPVAYAYQMENFLAPEITKRVAERTDHEVRFISAYAGTVAKVHETLEAVQNGILDIGGYCVCFETTKAKALGVSYFVPFSTPDVRVDVRVVRQLLGEYPGMYADLEEKYGQKLLAIGGFDNYGLGTDFPWEKIGELEGHKILAAGPNLPWLESSGAIPATGALPTFYNQLKTGVADGVLIFPGSYFGFKFHELAPHFKITDFGGTMQIALTMNMAKRASLPPEVVEIIDEVAAEWEVVTAEFAASKEQIGYDLLTEAGTEVTRISKEAQIAWARSLEPFVNASAEELTELGLPGSDILNRYMELMEAEGFEFPYRYRIN